MITTTATVRSFGHEMDSILEKEAFDIDLPTALGALGAGGGGLAGYAMTQDPNKKMRNAILAALLGGGAGWGVGRLASSQSDPIRRDSVNVEGHAGKGYSGHAPSPKAAPSSPSPRPSPIPDRTTQLLPVPSNQGWVRGEGPISIRESIRP